MKKIKKWILALIILLVVIAASCVWYVNDYYRSDDTVQEYLQGTEDVAVLEIEDGLFLDGKGEEKAIVFYPGAKVEYTAYVPLFFSLAEQGIDCFMVEMPGNLAILGQNKAENIMAEYEYEEWYLAGHSLGGAMAAAYSSKNIEELNGLILLAAYPTSELKDDAFSVISLYGSEDAVLNMEKVEEGREFVPENYKEICIEGGNHAWFGNYGEQEGDGSARITREEQQKQTTEQVLIFINSK